MRPDDGGRAEELRRRPIALIAIALLITGCAAQPQLQESATSGPAAALITQAESLQQSGDLRGAIAHAERAVRIEPRNAHAWHALARLHLANGELNKAEQFARRSNQFANGSPALMEANRALLEAVNRARQRAPG